jgi:pimeloyl-ACP methyl ester carboxylesterase
VTAVSTYVLVHGAWHGAWCWEKLVPLLEEQGHKVYTVDLPSHGADKTPVGQVTLQSYGDRVSEVLEQSDEPVTLVGHSMGGIAITQAAEQNPDKIKSLVYLTAFLLQNNESMVEIIPTDTEAIVARNMVVAEDGSSATLKSDELKNIFYAKCNDSDVERAQSRLTPQAIAPLATKLSYTDERYGRVPRFYIECLQDRAITNSCQKQMYTATPCEKVYTLDTDHSPFYSAPQELASILMSVS